MKAHPVFVGIGVAAVLLVTLVVFTRRARAHHATTPRLVVRDAAALARLENEGGHLNPTEQTS